MNPSHSSSDLPALNLPVPPAPLRRHPPSKIRWITFMEETSTRTKLYLSRYDDRQKRARSRNPDKFIWP